MVIEFISKEMAKHDPHASKPGQPDQVPYKAPAKPVPDSPLEENEPAAREPVDTTLGEEADELTEVDREAPRKRSA